MLQTNEHTAIDFSKFKRYIYYEVINFYFYYLFFLIDFKSILYFYYFIFFF